MDAEFRLEGKSTYAFAGSLKVCIPSSKAPKANQGSTCLQPASPSRSTEILSPESRYLMPLSQQDRQGVRSSPLASFSWNKMPAMICPILAADLTEAISRPSTTDD